MESTIHGMNYILNQSYKIIKMGSSLMNVNDNNYTELSLTIRLLKYLRKLSSFFLFKFSSGLWNIIIISVDPLTHIVKVKCREVVINNDLYYNKISLYKF